jgi:hypothetical protein
MRHRHTKLVAVTSALLLSLASTAGAAVLWDQSNWNPNNEGSLNLNSTSCSQISGNTKLHTASDVHFDSPVVITTVRIYETPGNVQTATMAYLWIAPKTGPLPTESSTAVLAGGLIPITISTEVISGQTGVIVTAGNLNIPLAAGDYWVSLTPRHSRGATIPWTVHRVTTGPIIGSPTAHIEACVVNSNWSNPLNPPTYDYAIKIEGDFPVPTLPSSWGKIKTLYR